MQQNIDERELYLRHVFRLAKWHKRNVEARMAKDAVTLESLVRALQEPRGVAKGHAESFRDCITANVRFWG